MTLRSPLVLDNVVLSSFKTAGWFESLAFPRPEYEIVVPEVIWKREFAVQWTVDESPDWIRLESSDSELVSDVPGQLSRADWTCIAIAEDEHGTVVTNDRALRNRCRARGVEVRWGTKFMIRIFKECGISQQEYDEGVDDYLGDVYLPREKQRKVREQTK